MHFNKTVTTFKSEYTLIKQSNFKHIVLSQQFEHWSIASMVDYGRNDGPTITFTA